MSTLNQFYGGSSFSPLLDRLFLSSGTFTPTMTGDYLVVVVGGGGSGGVCNFGTAASACGGGAGGLAIKKLKLVNGNQYTVVVGAGGASRQVQGGWREYGNGGGASSFSGPGITTITANGGSTGGYGEWSVGYQSFGGTASGGDFNLTGGRSGEITNANPYGVYWVAATGGGAVNIGQGANASGSIAKDSTYSPDGSWVVATGGAGVSGPSPGITGIGGGGWVGTAGGPGLYGIMQSTTTDYTNKIISSVSSLWLGLIDLSGNVSTGESGLGNNGVGMPANTYKDVDTGYFQASKKSNIFAGGCGMAWSSAGGGMRAGDGGIGAGGGGAANRGPWSQSGAGGNGIVIIAKLFNI